jgi:general L-amino acid transport system substrate-binding protein
MRLVAVILSALTAAIVALAAAGASAADPTLAIVKKRGELACGINGQLPGFSARDAQGQWIGLEIEFCRAVAAAVLGDANKVKFVPLNTVNRFDALRNGDIDLLARNSTATLSRTARTGVRDSAIIYIDGQVIVVPKSTGVAKLADLAGKAICTLKGTPYDRNTQDWFAARNLTIKTVLFDTQAQLYDSFFKDQCLAVVQDVSAVASTIIASGRAAEYLVLPELLATDPLAAYVRAGDDEWYDVVRWTHFAMLHGEDLGVTKANASSERSSSNPAVRRLLGVESDGSGKLLGLDADWAYNVLSQVGNYAESYDRNVGRNSPLKFSRGINALWTQGGAMYALPLH